MKENIKTLTKIYGSEKKELQYQVNRYENLQKEFKKKFKQSDCRFFRAAGRTEISGNHTDHNNGKVIAASLTLDSIAAVNATNDNKVILFSEGYKKPFEVNLNSLSVNKKESGTTNALIRGIASRLKKLGYNIGGFKGVITSNVFMGSGLSSSASIEVLISTIFNFLYNKGKIKPVEIAKISQYAENKFFGKPCGLMDQIACAFGGLVQIDFKDTEKPKVKKLEVDFKAYGYSLMMIKTEGNHADLTEEYAAIPKEMKLVAKQFGKKVLREISEKEFIAKLSKVKKKIGDRAILRALHYFAENKRVSQQLKALSQKDINTFIKLFNESGNSSFMFLQNIYSNQNIKAQPLALAIAMTKSFIDKIGNKGGTRVHGGGFAGTTLALIPNAKENLFKNEIEKLFGKNSVIPLKLSNIGVCEVV